mmetsp:Transcript_11150/g.31641  ORF Transcript_11150/g.31641 Transcript_11150/m.31641 type:complete len:206 (-) Transcript_11150:614-1231(-)
MVVRTGQIAHEAGAGATQKKGATLVTSSAGASEHEAVLTPVLPKHLVELLDDLGELDAHGTVCPDDVSKALHRLDSEVVRERENDDDPSVTTLVPRDRALHEHGGNAVCILELWASRVLGSGHGQNARCYSAGGAELGTLRWRHGPTRAAQQAAKKRAHPASASKASRAIGGRHGGAAALARRIPGRRGWHVALRPRLGVFWQGQ